MIQYAAKPAAITRTIAPPVARPACRTVLVSRMVGHVLELAFDGRAVSPETLKQVGGWSDATVKALWPEVEAEARRQSIRQIAGCGQ